ncbi:glucose-6-phosphate dehydrogenase (NADP(+)), partial [bacterium]|nr:glucose-6-phosphate dehydrogenase (NADP(+)) [bacterium]
MTTAKKALTPTTIVIFGITGDLAKRKLIPALWHLFAKGYLPDEFSIVGFARREWTDEELRAYVEEILKEKTADAERLENFLKRISYVRGDFGNPDSYRALFGAVSAIDEKLGLCSAKLMHLAVPPELYEGIFEQLHAAGLADLCGGAGGWTRVLVEKPFGNNWYTAEKLDQKMGGLFREEQIFRVDHYMGKEAMQNILAFRFSNALLEHLWNRSFIEKIHIRLFEELGTEGRGAFYDNVGALRDVGQNHVLQMLSFVAMEDPGVLEAEAIRKARAKVLEAILPISREDMGRYVKRGQYRGYLGEQNIRPDSKTETYFRIEAHIENDRWSGVPFILESGKKLGESKAEIEI